MTDNVMGFQNPTLDGNVLSIAPGIYQSIIMSGKPASIKGPLTIDGKGSTFTGTIYLPPTLEDVDFINFNFSNVINEPFHWANDQVKVGLRNLRFLNMTATGCDSFAMIGSWTSIAQQTGMSENIEFGNIVINSCRRNQVFFLCKSFGLKVHDVIINGAGNPQLDDLSHDGVIFIRWSDGEFYNNKINGAGGNGFRVFPAGNATRGYIAIHDNYVHNMRKHSAVESNGNETPDGWDADIKIFNNTFGNLAPGTYNSEGVAMYRQKTSKTYVKNNVVFNTSKGVIWGEDGTKPTEDTNNFYFPDALQAGVDLLTGKLLAASAAYGKAGAWVYMPPADIPPVAQPGPDQTVILPKNYILLDPAASTDADGKIISYAWEKLSGPPCTLIKLPDPATGLALAKDLVEGIYQFKLTVTDDQSATGSRIQTVTVKNAPAITGVVISYSDGAAVSVQAK